MGEKEVHFNFQFEIFSCPLSYEKSPIPQEVISQMETATNTNFIKDLS